MGLRLEALDTNILMRAVVGDIPEQAAKVYELLETPASIFYMPDQAITEAVFNLQGSEYGWDRETIVNALGSF